MFDFNEPLKPTPESLSLYVYAHWNDPSAPVVSLKRKSFNTFTYTAADNVGISAWACTQESTIATDSKDWHIIEPIAEFTGDYEISNSGDYYFYVRDDQGNVSSAKIHSNKISYDLGTGVNSIDLSENDVAVTTYALTGSTLTVNATIDEHYENLSIEYLAIKLNIGDTFVVSSDVTISATVTPKTYTVTFISKTHGYSPDSQSIVYLHTVVEPDPQIEDGYVLSAWCKDETLKLAWDFQNDVVTDNTTLYAKWVEYKEPTVFNISTDEANQIITFNFEQTSIDGLEVDWGDGSAIETNDMTGQIAMTHTYAGTGTYQISATKRTGEVYFGKDETAQAIVPITALSDVIFSWDVPTTKPYAFYKAVNLPTARLTRFMTRIADHAFDSCTGLSGSLEIPDSIIYIGDGAFESCGGLNELILPAKLSQLGDNAFDSCTKLEAVTFNPKSPLKSISSYAFNNCSALTAVNFSTNIISISDYAFANCTALESVTVPETITNLGYNVFYGDLSLSQVNLLAKSMTFHTAVFQNCPQLLTAGPYNSTGDQSYNIAFN